MQEPNDLEVVFGETAVFKCKAQGDPIPEIKWMLNFTEIGSSDSRVRVSDGTLEINRIDARDQGVYYDYDGRDLIEFENKGKAQF